MRVRIGALLLLAAVASITVAGCACGRRAPQDGAASTRQDARLYPEQLPPPVMPSADPARSSSAQGVAEVDNGWFTLAVLAAGSPELRRLDNALDASGVQVARYRSTGMIVLSIRTRDLRRVLVGLARSPQFRDAPAKELADILATGDDPW